MKKLFIQFLETVSFLTIIPVEKKTDVYNYKLFPLFPLVGGVIGLFCGILFKLLHTLLVEDVALLIVFIFYIAISDFFHLDGFVDTVDAIACFPNEKRHMVLKDPHVGSVGVIYIVVLILTKFWLLINLQNKFLVFSLFPVVSRWTTAVVGYNAKMLPTSSLGKNFVYKDIKIFILSFIIAFSIFLYILKDFISSILLFLICFIISFLLSKIFLEKKLGGINGDVFGFVCEITEVVVLFSFVLMKI